MARKLRTRYFGLIPRLTLAFGLRVVLVLSCGLSDRLAAANWPQFRGPQASGVSDLADPPLRWDVEAGRGVRWQQAIPGLAHASPIVWNDRIYLATVIKPGPKAELKVGLYGAGDSYAEKVPHQWRLLCLDPATGKILWNKLGLEAVPRLQRHTKATQCNSTPATDGQHIVAMFGSEGLFCFDLQGELRWRKDLGKLHATAHDAPTLQWGFASSPILYDGKVIVLCDVQKNSFLVAFDLGTGKELWRWDPEVNQPAVRPKICCGIVNRGPAIYNGMIFAPIIDGRLEALDALTGKVINVSDAYNDARFNPSIDNQTGYRTRNLLAVPLQNLIDGEVVGVNEALAATPELLNSAAHTEGWIAKIKLSQPDEITQLLSSADYEAYLTAE